MVAFVVNWSWHSHLSISLWELRLWVMRLAVMSRTRAAQKQTGWGRKGMLVLQGPLQGKKKKKGNKKSLAWNTGIFTIISLWHSFHPQVLLCLKQRTSAALCAKPTRVSAREKQPVRREVSGEGQGKHQGGRHLSVAWNKQTQKRADAFKCAGIRHATPDLDPPGQRKKGSMLNLGIVFKWGRDVNTVMPEWAISITPHLCLLFLSLRY